MSEIQIEQVVNEISNNPFVLKSYVTNVIQPDNEKVIDQLVGELSECPIGLQTFVISFLDTINEMRNKV